MRPNRMMCCTLVMSVLFCLKFNVASCQNNYVDSIKIANEREKISLTLNQLRDSINESATTLDNASKNAKARYTKKLESYSNELSKYSDQAKLAIDEIALTSAKGWTEVNLTRLKIRENSIRKDYYRVTESSTKIVRKYARRNSTASIY